MEDELTAVRQFVPVPPNQFAQPPLDTAANHRAADPPRHAEADAPWPRSFRRPAKHRKTGAAQPHPVFVNPLIFDSFSETAGLGEAL
jgi:hypothetical protein